MILDATTKSVELILGAAVTTNAMPITVDYVDLTTTTTLAGSSDTQSNGTTAVTIVAAPAASTQRKVNALTVFNADTASKVVTIRLNNNATLRNLISVTLQVGDTIGYSDTSGWYLLDSDGNLKSVQSASATSIASAIHGATNKTTPVDADEVGIWDSVTGLLNHVTWANIKATLKAYFDTLYAALAGSASQTFSVAAATAAAHAVRSDQLSTDNTNFPIYTAPTSFSTVLSAGTGTFTNATAGMSILSIGKFRHVEFSVSITTNGTAAGSVLLTLPDAPQNFVVGQAREWNATGAYIKVISAAAAQLSLYLINDTYPGGDGYLLRGTIDYFVP